MATSKPFEPWQPMPDADELKRVKLRKGTPGGLVQVYLTLRDERDAAQATVDDRTHKMELVADVIQEKMVELDQDAFSAASYTVFRYTLVTTRVRDPAALRALILRDPARNLDLVEMRSSKDAALNWMLQHAVVNMNGDDITPPPDGVEIVQHLKLGVRKK